MANQPVQDGSVSSVAGQNASKVPDQVPANAYYSAVNITNQNGVPAPPFGFDEQNLIFPTTEFTLPLGSKRSYESIFKYGKYQALIPYSIGNSYFTIVIISGVIFLINQKTLEVSIIEIADGSKLDEHADRIKWSPAGRYLVLFDYPAYPVILEGQNARRSNPSNMEVPISTQGTYNQNRLFVANALNEFTASDPAAYGFPEGPISFTEIETPASNFYGQVFQLSTNYNNDPITGMGFLQSVDTSTGIGPLLVSTQNSIYSYQAQKPRDQWETSQFGSLFIAGTGFAGPRSFCNVNSDLFFMSPDGQIRSASMSRTEQQRWSKVPLSKEVDNYLKFIDPELVKFSVVFYYKNKIFVTANPYRVVVEDTNYQPIFDYVHGGFVVLELDNVASLTGGDSTPAWAGLRTSVRPMDMIVNNDQAFIISKEGNINKLYKIRSDIRYDIVGPKKEVREIKSRIYTKEFTFETPFNTKQLRSLEVTVAQVKGYFKLKVYYKTSQNSKFLFWREFIHKAPYQDCSLPIQGGTILPQDFREILLGYPMEVVCDPITNYRSDMFRRLQLLFEIEGVYWELRGFVVRADLIPQNETQVFCGTLPEIIVRGECINKDWLIEDTVCQ